MMMAYNHHDMTSIVVRQEQARAQIAALSCEITLNAVKKGIKNAIARLKGKPKTKYEYNLERKRDVKRMKAVTKVKTRYQLMYNVEEEPPSGPTYKTLDVDPSLFIRHYQQPSFTQSLKLIHPSFYNFDLLERIDVSHQLIGDSGLESLCAAIQGSLVQVLNLSGNQISDTGIRHLMGILRSLHKLTSLNLSHNSFGDLGISFITDRKLYHSGTVTQYDFTYNKFTPLAGHHIGNLFLGDSQGFCPISHLRFGGDVSLYRSGWGDDFIKQFLSPFLKSPNIHKLKVLFLTDCNLSDISIQCISGLLLCDQCALEELSLSKCFFTPSAKELLQRVFLLTRKRFQLFAHDCGVSVKELQYWQEELINASPEQKHRLQKTLMRYEQSLQCISVTQQALLSCHIAQYYLRQQMLNSWNIEAPVRWQTNPMIHEKTKQVHNLADETGIQLDTNDNSALPPIGGPSSPGSSGIVRKQQPAPLQRQGSVTRKDTNSSDLRPSSAGGGSGKGEGLRPSSAEREKHRSSSPSLNLPSIQRGASFAAGQQSSDDTQPQQQIILGNAASAKTHNAFNTATFVDTELLRQVTCQRDPLCRLLAQQLVELMHQANFVHFIQEVLAFMIAQSFNQQEVPMAEQVPAMAQAARSELADIHVQLKKIEQLHILRLSSWSSSVDAIILEGKDFLRRIEQEQNEALLSNPGSKQNQRNQKSKETNPMQATNSPLKWSQFNSDAAASAPTKQFSKRSQKASIRVVKVNNDENMERLYMMQEDAWARTIEQDRIDCTFVVISQQQSQSLTNASGRFGRSKRTSANSTKSLSQHSQQDGQNASFALSQTTASSSTPMLPPISGSSNNFANKISDSLASARSDSSGNSSKPSATASSKKQQRQAVAAERAMQQQYQAIIKEGHEYHRKLISNAVPCASTLGSIGFFLYYLHTVYSKEVEAAGLTNK